MAKMMKARKGGFTLVELLIVIMIVAILAGMMMLATGSATDSAEATKVINDLRSIKSAALLYYIDNGQWPVQATMGNDTIASLDRYMDRPLFGASNQKYQGHIIAVSQDVQGSTVKEDRMLIGIKPANGNFAAGIKNKLQGGANTSGIIYDGNKTAMGISSATLNILHVHEVRQKISAINLVFAAKGAV